MVLKLNLSTTSFFDFCPISILSFGLSKRVFIFDTNPVIDLSGTINPVCSSNKHSLIPPTSVDTVGTSK